MKLKSIFDEHVVRMSFVQMLSLMARGMPRSDLGSFPIFPCTSSAVFRVLSSFTVIKAFTLSSTASILSQIDLTKSLTEISFLSRRSLASEIVRLKSSNSLIISYLLLLEVFKSINYGMGLSISQALCPAQIYQ